MFRRPFPALASTLLACGILVACLDSEDGSPRSGSREGMTITNDEGSLNERLTERNEEILVEDSAGNLSKAAAKNFKLTLVAELEPPVVDGERLQATSVSLHGGFAYISYALRGEAYAGGVDVVQLRSGKNAVVRSSATFTDMEVHALHHDGDLYLAGSLAEPASEGNPAVLERMTENGGKLELKQRKQAGLESFAATSVASAGKNLYVTSGNAGGLFILDKTTLKAQASVKLDDARWVDANATRVAVVQGTPGRLAVFAAGSSTPFATHAFDGADIPESKSTVQILGDRALVAAGNGGVKLVALESGKIVASLPRPVVANLDSTLTVTNAAAGKKDILYVSNGEAGIYVVQAGADLDKPGGDADVKLTVLGKLKFSDFESANHVAYDGSNLIVAAGLGGVKIVAVEGI